MATPIPSAFTQSDPTPSPLDGALSALESALSRQDSSGAAVAATAVVARELLACAPTSQANWTTVPAKPVAAAASGSPAAGASAAPATPAATAAASAIAFCLSDARFIDSPPAGRSTTSTPGMSFAATSAISRRRLRTSTPTPPSPSSPDILGATDDYPAAPPEARVRPGPAARPERRRHAAHARGRRQRQSVQAHRSTRSRPADRRALAAGRRRSATTRMARPDDPG